MILPLTSLRKRVRLPAGIGGPTGLDIDVKSDDDIDEYLNLSYGALLNTFEFREKEVTAILSTVIGRRNYPMPNPHDGLRHIDILHPSSLQHTALLPMTVTDYISNWNETTSAYGYPTHYVRENCLFRLWPTPDAVYELTVRYWGILQDLVLDNQSIEIPSVWMEPIIIGAVVRLFLDLGDVTRADEYGKWQSKLIADIIPTKSKDEEDYHRAGLEVLGREY